MSYSGKEKQEILVDAVIQNIIASSHTSFMSENIGLSNTAGVKEKVVRVLKGEGCEFCRRLAGTYDYPYGYPEEIFQRHDSCKCEIYHISSKGVQDARFKNNLSPNQIMLSPLSKHFLLEIDGIDTLVYQHPAFDGVFLQDIRAVDIATKAEKLIKKYNLAKVVIVNGETKLEKGVLYLNKNEDIDRLDDIVKLLL